MDALYNRIPTMPEAYLIEIEQGGEGISQLEILEGNVAACQHALDMDINDAKRLYRMDYEDGGSIDNMINFVANLDGLSNRYELAALYLEKKDYTQMQNTLNAIPELFELSDQQLAEQNNWNSYFSIAKSLRQKPVPFDGLTQDQKTTLEGIVEAVSNTPPTSAALALLIFNNPDYDYVELVKEFSIENQRKARPRGSVVVESAETELFKVYPNPTHDYFTLEYHTSEQYSSIWFVIQDVSGRILMQQTLQSANSESLINISQLPAGAYTLILYGDGKPIETKKITVVK